MDPGRAPLRIFLAHPMNEITQAAINPRPPCPFHDFQRQKTLKLARCQRRMVSGCTTWATPSRLGQSRVIHMSDARSPPRSRKRGGARRKAMAIRWWRNNSRLQAGSAT